MAFSDKKIAEGLEHLRLADKCMKTSIFKWKPDLDGAMAEYNKAAVAFTNAKAYEQAVNCYTKASDVQKQHGSNFHAAKSLESAAMIEKEQGDLNRAVKLIQDASQLYLQHGTPDTAAIALDRAGKMVQQKEPEKAADLFKRACDVAEGEGRPGQCAEFIGKAGRLLIRLRRLEEAADCLKKEIDWFNMGDNHGAVNKLVMGSVMVHLHRGDYVAADQFFQRALRDYMGFAESEEAGPIERLLDAYDQGDQETAEQIVKSPLFRYMENDFVKLARDLRVPGGGKPKEKNNSSSKQGAPGAKEEDDDDFDGGLC